MAHPSLDQRSRRGRPGRKLGPPIPDILYHATSLGRGERAITAGVLLPGSNRRLVLSGSESDAWRVAHRTHDEPTVLYIDAGRARREGVRLLKQDNDLYITDRMPVRYVLNLRPGFREQVSAGGLLVRRDRGAVELALVACSRRGRLTWEIAKGKLEPGETPEQAAMRELQEEMGFTGTLRITARLGQVRYGFRTPEGDPRLKTLYVYTMEAEAPPERFSPARAEGITEVRWFSVPEACRLVTHSSLLPMMRDVRALLGAAGADDDPFADDSEPLHVEDAEAQALAGEPPERGAAADLDAPAGDPTLEESHVR